MLKRFQYQTLTLGKRSERQLSTKSNFCPFCQFYPLPSSYNTLKSVRINKISKTNMFEAVWRQLESKKGFQRESIAKYLRLTLGFC